MTVSPSPVSVLDKLTDVTFAVIDIETTGFDMNGADRICEVAVVRGRLGAAQPVDSWSSLVNPGRTIPYGAARVNHITDSMVRNQPLFAGIAEEFMSLVENCVLVFHNASFDLPFLQTELKRAGLQAARMPKIWLDTCLLARHNYSFVSNKLGDLIAQVGLSREANPNHRALNDTLATWSLLGWLLEDLGRKQPEPLSMLQEVVQLQAGSQPRRVFTTGAATVRTEQTVTVETSQDASGTHWQAVVERETDTTFEFFQVSEGAGIVFKQWQSGEIPLEAALPTLCSHFAQLDDMATLLEEQLKTVRDQLSQVIQATGGKAEIPQFGKLQLTGPQTVSSFDRKLLEELVTNLQAAGNSEIAAAIAACKSESNRAGGLRISRSRP